MLSDWRVLGRRWYVILTGVLITGGLAFAASTLIPLQYQVTANVLMLPPKTVNTQGKITNPYLDLEGLDGVADVVSKALTEQSVTDSIKSISPSGQYTVLRDPSSAAPVILITVQAETTPEALRIQQSLLDRVPQTLQAIQRSSAVHSDSFITSSVITQDAKSTVLRKSQIRALVVILVGGLGVTFLFAALIDGMLRSRKSNRAGVRGLPQGSISGLLDEGGVRPLGSGYPAGAAGRPRAVGFPEFPDPKTGRPRTGGFPEPGHARGAQARAVSTPPDVNAVSADGATRPLDVIHPEHDPVRHQAGEAEDGEAHQRPNAYGALTLRKPSTTPKQARDIAQ